jgi:nucleotide-binding universal stress UspA family protein
MPTLRRVTRLSLKNILVPTDFSVASRAALPFATTLAASYGSTILVAHTIAPEPHRQVVADPLSAEDDRCWQDASWKLFEFARDPLLSNVPTRTTLNCGDLATVIPALVDEQHVDLIVLGTHGRRGVSKMILGSSAESIYRSATCPVLTVGPAAHKPADWKPRRILCPVDSAEDREPALPYALSLAEENEAEFIVLEAIPLVPWQHRSSVERTTRRALERLIPEDAKNWCLPQYVVRWEHPAEAILNESLEREVDLIVMSVRRSRAAAWSAHLPWPVASEVVSQARCPVITVRV